MNMDNGILTVLVILTVTIILLVVEAFRIDLTAILCLLALSWSKVLTPAEALSGFSSQAVIAMMSVMIMGRAIALTGVMHKFSVFILGMAKKSKRKLIALMSLIAGLFSSFMQNVGSAALFLPAMITVSKKRNIPASELIMPLGFAIILGGTLTMVASGPLIILNDLLRNAGLKPYRLFDVTPVGLVLLAAGIVFFMAFGKRVLPRGQSVSESVSEQKKLIDAWHLPHVVCRYRIPSGSILVGMTPENSGIWNAYSLSILAVSRGESVQYAPWRHTRFQAGQQLALLGNQTDIRRFAGDFRLKLIGTSEMTDYRDEPAGAGFVEVLIPPHSTLAGSSMRKLAFRKNYAVEPVLFFSQDRQVRGDFSDRKIRAGDTLILYGLWESILRLKTGGDFVVITPFKTGELNRGKAGIAVLCFMGAIGLTVAGFPISISLLTGAMAMVLTRVIAMSEAYRAVEWKVVFLIAGLIPLGLAMQKTGTAEFLAGQITGMVRGGHPIALLFAVAALSTLFSLFMSNVASTVLLVPLVINLAGIGGLDPRPLVLMVAVCAANSFILPTHQVNAMFMTPGGYRNADYFRAGGGITLVFLLVVVGIFYLFYL